MSFYFERKSTYIITQAFSKEGCTGDINALNEAISAVTSQQQLCVEAMSPEAIMKADMKADLKADLRP